MTNGSGNTTNLQPHRGETILVLGILGLVICGICGIIALVMGSKDLKAMDAGLMDEAGRGYTKAGWIMGIIATVFMGIAVVILIIYAIIIATMGMNIFR